MDRVYIDPYEVKVVVSKTKYRITITITVSSVANNNIRWQFFWEYPNDNKNLEKAEKTFKEIVGITDRIVEKFVYEEQPTVLVHCYLKDALIDIDIENQKRQIIR